jgi:twitching motility protein PilU
MNLRGIISQRLVRKKTGGRVAALEIMLNQGYIKELIGKGEVKELKKIMAENVQNGMQTFDQALLKLVMEDQIDEETALGEADNQGDLKLQLKQAKISGSGGKDGGLKSVDTSKLSLGA